jgi:hypothetical protein
MFCSTCRMSNPDGASFCAGCGAPLTPAVGIGVPAAPGSGQAVTSLVLGILGLGGWCIPIVGLPLTIVGLVLGIRGLRSTSRGIATAGIVLCVIGLVAASINAAVGAYMGVTGQHPLVNMLRQQQVR